jgi:hypothetical protein
MQLVVCQRDAPHQQEGKPSQNRTKPSLTDHNTPLSKTPVVLWIDHTQYRPCGIWHERAEPGDESPGSAIDNLLYPAILWPVSHHALSMHSPVPIPAGLQPVASFQVNGLLCGG